MSFSNDRTLRTPREERLRRWGSAVGVFLFRTSVDLKVGAVICLVIAVGVYWQGSEKEW